MALDGLGSFRTRFSIFGVSAGNFASPDYSDAPYRLNGAQGQSDHKTMLAAITRWKPRWGVLVILGASKMTANYNNAAASRYEGAHFGHLRILRSACSNRISSCISSGIAFDLTVTGNETGAGGEYLSRYPLRCRERASCSRDRGY